MGKFEDIDSLFRSFYRPLCLYASKFIPDSEAVEDLVQDVFIAYWNRLQDGMPVPSSPKSYLYRAVHNKCLDVHTLMVILTLVGIVLFHASIGLYFGTRAFIMDQAMR